MVSCRCHGSATRLFENAIHAIWYKVIKKCYFCPAAIFSNVVNT